MSWFKTGKLKSREVAEIKKHYDELIAGPEASLCEITYVNELSASNGQEDIYKNTSSYKEKVSLPGVRHIQKFLNAWEIRNRFPAYEASGVCEFYLPSSLDMMSPVHGKPVTKGTMIITDKSGVRWSPITEPFPGSSQLERAGANIIGNVVACHTSSSKSNVQ